ncbi:MAG TPA: YbhB/YbcL family Raf kinase inhibitor-like protein [Micromonosporaceae bacterium]|nr:YbhB/YbcL family Raf kinase inhibitor-like protein [Micromonosporaceae bacterium]HCU48576.1 YbhB/YbcL family Raf kinase inhibitor-like protein [Micromonosporaceae bacterium]
MNRSTLTDLHLRSSAFTGGEALPPRFARDTENISPPLAWSDVPRAAVELVLWCEDPDPPSGPFLHWLVTGISPDTKAIAEGQVPDAGQQWLNSFGETGWGGPQPPRGDRPHHYVFHLCALDRPIHLPPQPAVADINKAVRDTRLAHGQLIGTYSR